MSVVHHNGQHQSVTNGPHIPSSYLAAKTAREGQDLLDAIHQQLSMDQGTVGEIHGAMESLFLSLERQRELLDEAEWHSFVKQCRAHPVRAAVHQDPFTYRAFSKPRGYAGDAELMDYIYGQEEFWTPPEASSLGQQIFSYTTLAPAAEGVRARRGYIAHLLDDLAYRIQRPHILSIASGHLREVSISAAARRRKFGRIVALDADAKSLDEVRRSYGALGVETYPAHIRRLLTKRLNLGHFDLVYSTGLFDYLELATGRRMVSSMFEMLRPGGTLVVANFLPGIRDAGYMEAFMDWTLIYRSRQEMVDLTMEIRQEEISDLRLFADESRNILFLQVTRDK